MSASDIIHSALVQGRPLLTEVEAKTVVQEVGIPVVETYLATSKSEAAKLARQLGFPVVLKVVSTDIVHKSEVGGVRLGIGSARELSSAYDTILASVRQAVPSADIKGVSVQRMAPPGLEVVIGATLDTHFGHLMMFGMGGVNVEVLKDVVFRLSPLSQRDARQMVQEIRGYPLLQGFRGSAPSDVPALERALLFLSDFLQGHPEIKELDLNPVFAYPQGIAAVDARIVLEKDGLAVGGAKE